MVLQPSVTNDIMMRHIMEQQQQQQNSANKLTSAPKFYPYIKSYHPTTPSSQNSSPRGGEHFPHYLAPPLPPPITSTHHPHTFPSSTSNSPCSTASSQPPLANVQVNIVFVCVCAPSLPAPSVYLPPVCVLLAAVNIKLCSPVPFLIEHVQTHYMCASPR